MLTPAEFTTVTFTKYAVFESSAGSRFTMFSTLDTPSVLRVDDRFLHHISTGMQKIDNGEVATFVCRPDTGKPKDWRLDLMYYESEHQELNQIGELQKIPKPENHDYKKLSFSIPADLHAYITSIYKQKKKNTSNNERFSDFNSALYTRMWQMVKTADPYESLPF